MYLDNAATTQVSQRAIEAMVNNMTYEYGNPSSLHAKGLEAERRIKSARQTLAAIIKADPKQLIFTSGATESSNTILKSAIEQAKGDRNHIITTQIEHPSVLEVIKKYQEKGYRVTYLPCNEWGVVEENSLRQALTEHTFLVSIMAVNNEVGSIQPIKRFCDIVKGYRSDILFHTDAVQALGKIPVDMGHWGIDAASFSGHKLHGPKGIGMLYVKSSSRLHPLVFGGGQELGLRSGTENVPGIIGFAAAAEGYFDKEKEHQARYHLFKSFCIGFAESSIEDCMVLSPLDSEHSNSILSIALKDIKSEVLVHELERHEVYVSSGSACSSHKKGSVSHVVQSMRVPKKFSEGVIRISFSTDHTEEELHQAMILLKGAVESQRELIQRRHR